MKINSIGTWDPNNLSKGTHPIPADPDGVHRMSAFFATIMFINERDYTEP